MSTTHRANPTALTARVARSLSRSAIHTALQAEQVSRGASAVAHTMLFERRLNKTKNRALAEDAKVLVNRLGGSVDPRVVLGGLSGLTAGEIFGITMGGIVGTMVAGPAGGMVGLSVGAVAGGHLGFKTGTDLVQDIVESPNGTPAANAVITPPPASKRPKRLGQAAGITAGASVGTVVAGPAAGIILGILGQIVGGQLVQEKVATASPTAPPSKPRVPAQTTSPRQSDANPAMTSRLSA